jgi:hypothetical protein
VDGNAPAFVSHLAPEFKHYINGEVEETPWTDALAMQSLFDRLAISQLQKISSAVSAGPTSLMVIVDWDLEFRDTLERLEMGEWQQTYSFNDRGKIVKIDSIADGAVVQQFYDLMGLPTPPSDAGYRPAVEALVNAVNAKDANAFLSAFASEDVYWKRNGQNDTFVWTKPKFLGYLFQEQISVQLDAFANAVPRTSYAVLTWTLSAKGKTITIPDSWFITWNTEGKISHIRSVTDGQEKIIYAFLMPRIAEKLAPEKKEQLAKLYKAGTLSPEDFRKHLDL